jgi:hypothetical protein
MDKKEYDNLIKKTYIITFILVGCIMLYMYISHLLGVNYTIMPNQSSKVRSTIIEFIIFSAGFFPALGYICNLYDKRLLYISVPYLLLIELPVSFIHKGLDMSTIAPMFLMLIIGLWQRDIMPTIGRMLKYLIPMGIYQFLMLYLKTDHFVIGYNDLPNNIMINLMIDQIIFSYLLFFKGGETHGFTCWQFSICPKSPINIKMDKIDIDEAKRVSNLQFWKRMLIIFLNIILTLTQLSIIVFLGHLHNRAIEALILTVSFLAYGGFLFRRRWHADSIILCTGVTVAMFYCTLRVLPPLRVSIVASVLMALMLNYLLYRVALWQEQIDQLRLLIQSHNKE